MRASFHFYNNEDDVDRFVAAVASLRDAFAPHGSRRSALGAITTAR